MDSDYDSEPESIYEEPLDDSDADENYVPEDDAEEQDIDDDDALEDTEDAETQIAGDFDRLVSRAQRADAHDNAGWDFDIEDKEIDFDEEIRLSSGIGRRKTRRSRAVPELSQEVKQLMGEANSKYTGGHHADAITLYREVIKIEPAAPGVWALLALCHSEIGEVKQALQLEIIDAHLGDPDVDIWRNLGQRSKDAGYIQQACYCFHKVLSIDPYDMDALWDRSYLLKVSGNSRKAIEGFLKILKYQPTNADVLEQLRLIYLEMNDAKRARIIFQDAFNHCKKHNPQGPHRNTEEPEFGVIQIIALADFYNNAGDYEKAIRTIRQGARWLDGRLLPKALSEEWDSLPDDREFDIEEYPREGYEPTEFHPLDVNLRERLAVSRLRLGEFQEAEMHVSIVCSTDILSYSVLFADIADVYFSLGMYDEALRIYLELGAHEETSSVPVLVQIGECHRHMTNYDEAIEVFTWALNAAPERVEIKTKLAETYEVIGQFQKALELITEVLQYRESQQSTSKRPKVEDTPDIRDDLGIGSFFDENRKVSSRNLKNRDISREQRNEYERQREQTTIATFARLDAAEEAMLQGDRRAIQLWVSDAGTLVEDFRVTKQLFLTDRNAKFRGMIIERRQNRSTSHKTTSADEGDKANKMARRLQRELVDDDMDTDYRSGGGVTLFRGASFDRWLLFITQYCFLLTREDQYPLAKEVLKHTCLSNVFSSFAHQNTFRMANITCAVHARDLDNVIAQCRSFTLYYPFNNDVVRLTLACLDGGVQSTSQYTASNYQKFMKRELGNYDLAVTGAAFRKANGPRPRIPSGKYVKIAARKGLNRGGPSKKISTATSDEETGSSTTDDGGDNKAEDSDDDSGDDDEETNGNDGRPTKAPKQHNALMKNPTPDMATKLSPVLLAHYGQMNMCAKSFQGSIYYLLQAYELQPRDPLLCLDLAVACLHRAMQRQADNRHSLVVESLAFLDQYRQLRTSEDLADEVEYNFGRAFHQLSLMSFAVKHYEEALKIVRKRLQSSPTDYGCAREAAYNLSLIYNTTGAPGLAHTLYKEWLSV